MHTEVRFASFLSGGFTTMAVMNPPEKKLEKRTSVQCSDLAKNRITEEISQKFAAASGFAKSFSSWGLNAPLAGAMDPNRPPLR